MPRLLQSWTEMQKTTNTFFQKNSRLSDLIKNLNCCILTIFTLINHSVTHARDIMIKHIASEMHKFTETRLLQPSPKYDEYGKHYLHKLHQFQYYEQAKEEAFDSCEKRLEYMYDWH